MQRVGWITLIFLAIGVAGYAFAIGLIPDLGPRTIVSKFSEFPLPLLAHTIGGGIALVLGLFQVHPRFRSQFTRSHRRVGKVYFLAVFLSGFAGLYMATIAEGGLITELGFGMLAVLWLATAIMAIIRIRQRNISAHRAWMIRNYALTLSAVTLRFYLPASLASNIDFLTAYMVIAWMCWVPNLIIAEWFFVRNDPIRAATSVLPSG